MCSNNSPTCVLRSGSCLQQEVATISSEMNNSSDFFDSDKSLVFEDQSPTPPLANQSRCCPMTGILPAITRTHDNALEGDSQSTSSSKPAKSNKTSGWKTSKFFSKTMSSGEILRGLKKLSMTSSGSGLDTGDQQLTRKTKSGQLKKRSSNDDSNVMAGTEDDPKARSPRSPGSFRPLSKAMSVSEPGSSTKGSNLGIVCRKEDLKAILCSASKKFPLASPRKKRNQAPLRQTKSASFDMAEDGPPKKEPVRRAGSEESKTKRNLSVDPSIEQQESHPEHPPKTPPSHPEKIQVNPTPKPEVTEEVLSPEGSLSTVKWDECEVVDAVIIGDAIESFLKGSMMGADRRVYFRRTSDKKIKSDG